MSHELPRRTRSLVQNRCRWSRSRSDRGSIARSGPERWSSGIPPLRPDFSKPMQAVGGLFAMSADAVKSVFRRPFPWREFLQQCWFVARVSLAPTLLVAIPLTVQVSFTLNLLLRELGAA